MTCDQLIALDQPSLQGVIDVNSHSYLALLTSKGGYFNLCMTIVRFFAPPQRLASRARKISTWEHLCTDMAAIFYLAVWAESLHKI